MRRSRLDVVPQGLFQGHATAAIAVQFITTTVGSWRHVCRLGAAQVGITPSTDSVIVTLTPFRERIGRWFRRCAMTRRLLRLGSAVLAAILSGTAGIVLAGAPASAVPGRIVVTKTSATNSSAWK